MLLSSETICQNRRENTVRIRSCCIPFAQGFCSRDDSAEPGGKDWWFQGNTAKTEQIYSGQNTSPFPTGWVLSPKTILVDNDRILFPGGKVAVVEGTPYCTVCRAAVTVNALVSLVSAVGNRLSLTFSQPRKLSVSSKCTCSDFLIFILLEQIKRNDSISR